MCVVSYAEREDRAGLVLFAGEGRGGEPSMDGRDGRDKGVWAGGCGIGNGMDDAEWGLIGRW